MKTNSEIGSFIKDEGGCLIAEHPDTKTLETAMRAIEGALLCIGEGNTARAAQLLYGALPEDRRPLR